MHASAGSLEALSAVEIVYCCVALVLAYAVRDGAGFGSAAAMPLLGLVVPIKVLVPVWTLLRIASSIAILARDYREVTLRDALRVMPTCLVGVAVGLYFFKQLDARTLAQGLSVLVIAYGGHVFWSTTRSDATSQPFPPALAPIAGVLSGLVGTLFGTMATLFFAIYLDAKRLAKIHFRATLAGMLLTGYLAIGEFGREAWAGFAAAFPMTLLGLFIGDRIHLKLSELAFRRAVGVILIVSGAALSLR